MGMRKYQKAEASEVLSQESHEAISDELHKLGKTSARDLDSAERQKIDIKVGWSNESVVDKS